MADDHSSEFGSPELFAIVQELAGLGVWSFDLATERITWSAELYRTYGLEPDAFDGSFEGYLALVHPDDRTRIAEIVRRAPAAVEIRAEGGGGPAGRFSFDNRIVRPDGEVRVLESMGAVLRDASGAPVRLIGACTDVTDERALRARIAHQERLSTIGTLAAGMAHELNNPLFYVRASLEHLRDALGDVASFEVADIILDMLEGIDRMSQIIEDLQAPTRLLPGATGPIGLAEVTEAALGVVSHELRHRAQVRRDLYPDVFVSGSQRHLQQVVVNLLANAAQALPTGRASEHQVHLALEQEGDDAVLTVSHSGDPPDPGTGGGMGLYVTYGMVAGLGGQLGFSSSDQGTRATLRLPAVPRPEPPRSERRQDAADAGRATVLVVDDDPLAGRALQMQLRGHDVVVVTSAEEARATLAGGFRPQLMLIDLMMPDGLGHELFAEIESRYAEIAPRVRFITGGAYAPEIEEFAHRYAHLTLRKPFTRSRLLEVLGSVVSA